MYPQKGLLLVNFALLNMSTYIIFYYLHIGVLLYWDKDVRPSVNGDFRSFLTPLPLPPPQTET